MTPESEIIALDRFIDSLESKQTSSDGEPNASSIAGLADTVLELRRNAEPSWPGDDFPTRAAARIADAVRGTTGDQTHNRPESVPPQSPNGRALTALATSPAIPSTKRCWFKEFGQVAAAVLALALVAGLLALLFQDRHDQAGIEQIGVVGIHHNGAIIFTSSRSGNDEIYAVDPDGTNLRQLTNDPEMDFSPIWSPDGTKIAFMRMQAIPGGGIPPAARPPISIYVMNADGSDKRNLTPDGSRSFRNLVWSPDSKQLAVECAEKPTDRGGNGQICVLNTDGTGMHRVVPPNLAGQTPVWSPDGKWIAFRGQTQGEGLHVGLYLVSPDSSRQRAVLSDFDVSGSFAWSPDSREIAYVYEPHALTIIDIDNSRTRNLDTGDRRPSDPVWSPDGSKLFFLWQSADRTSSGVEVMDADGTPYRDMSSTGDQIISAIWSPDGQAIAIMHQSLNRVPASPETASLPARLGVFYLNGSPSRTLVEENTATDGHGFFDSQPSWQPIH